MLKQTGVRLKLLKNVDSQLFIEQGTLMESLLRASGTQKPTTRMWKIATQINQTVTFNILTRTTFTVGPCVSHCRRGWILDVHLEYLVELHKAHNRYPLAPEKRKIKRECISDYEKTMADKLGWNKTKQSLSWRCKTKTTMLCITETWSFTSIRGWNSRRCTGRWSLTRSAGWSHMSRWTQNFGSRPKTGLR